MMTYPSDLNELIKDHLSTGNYGKSRKYNQMDIGVRPGTKQKFIFM
jgi:hypothetical protein